MEYVILLQIYNLHYVFKVEPWFLQFAKSFNKSRRFLQYGVKADQLEKYGRDIVGIQVVDIDNDKQYMNDDDSKNVVVVNNVLQI